MADPENAKSAVRVSLGPQTTESDIAAFVAVWKAIADQRALDDAVLRSMPLGANGFGKGGSIDYDGSHVLTFAGGVYVPDRWVYFALFLNWSDEDGGDTGVETGGYLSAAQSIFTLIRDRLTR